MPKLTKTIIESTKVADGDTWLWDSEVEGFGVRIQSSGRKTYVVRYRTKDAQRIQRKMTLARCSDMPPEKARELARKVFAKVADGQDPALEQKPAKAGVITATVERLFMGYVAHLRAAGKVSAGEVERSLLTAKDVKSAADALGRQRAAADVTPIDVVNFVSASYQRGKRATADKARSYIASAYSWGIASTNDYTVPAEQRIDWGIIRNPAADVAKDSGATNARERNLSAPEIFDIWNATLTDNTGFAYETGAAIRTLLACGQRVQETLRLDGRDIDLDARLWTMPAHKTKGKKRQHLIPLPAIIIPTLQQLIDMHGDGPLFPGRTGSQEEILSFRTVTHAIGRWVERDDVNIEHFQARDLRRTWKSRTGDGAMIDRSIRDLIQQHAKTDTGSKHYDFSDYLPQMREAMAKWSNWLTGVVTPQELAKAA